MNHVLVDAEGVVAIRSVVAFDPVPDGYDAYETNDWPMPGNVRLGDGSFAAPPPILEALQEYARGDVTRERDRRIDAGFPFGGVRYQSGVSDRENIAGAAQLATMALLFGGAQPGDLRWHGGASDFVWIAEDNSLTLMDAPTVVDFAKTAAAAKSACIFFARGLKDQVDACADAEELAAIDITAGWPA